MKQQTEEQKARLRKFLLVLPVIIIFCAALLFAALGGGKGTPDDQPSGNKGINTRLPDAKFGKAQPQDKLSLYDQATKDSVKSRGDANNPIFSLNEGHGGYSTNSPSADASAAKINQKLSEISREINKPEPVVKPSTYSPNLTQSTSETDKLTGMLQAINNKNSEDPELRQLNAMLDKIAAIQTPVPAQPTPANTAPQVKADSIFKAIPAIIEGNQKVAQGGVVKLRILDSIVVKNVKIPNGQLLFGACNITNQRLLLDIKNIRIGTSIIPVSFSTYSLDGLAGIDAPEAELAEAAGTGTANAVQGMELLPMDMSLSTQAASAGINAAKTLISKKAKKIKVKLHNGQQVLLRLNKY
ncbi:conjugative transposon protein TraM [Mucilaginibacter sp. CAU 1740]|uniref:conjugative transposon protein TraM n=1 Tax=Mucilaginibacter sp. CAU 1740 TaxID=3140365 RepID=UPI00325B8EA4